MRLYSMIIIPLQCVVTASAAAAAVDVDFDDRDEEFLCSRKQKSRQFG